MTSAITAALYILIALVFGAPASYFMKCMILEPKEDHFGFLKSSKSVVVFAESGHEQPVVFWDHIRRIFGAYVIYDSAPDKWIVEVNRTKTERFTCPFCLSFWTAIPFTIVWYFLNDSLFIATLVLIPTHLTIAVMSQIFYKELF